jgi:hypothetical protein
MLVHNGFETAGSRNRRWLLAVAILAASLSVWALSSASGPSTALAAPSCPLDPTQPTMKVGMTLEGCEVVANAPSSVADPLSFWGAVDCESPTRAERPLGADDPAETALGEDQWGADAYRELTVYDGDDVWGERCELGLDDREEGPTVFYHEGQHRVTYMSLRLPNNFPLATEKWQTVMSMKETQLSHSTSSGVPALFMGAYAGAWHVESPKGDAWDFPATTNRWTRFAWDVYYSKDASKGWLQVSADLNGDGAFDDPGERSPVIRQATLKTEATGAFNAEDDLAAGASIPSHLRIGISHDPSVPCPSPAGCSISLDNIQVIDAGDGEEPTAPPPPPPVPVPPTCAITQTASKAAVGMTLPGCKMLGSDTATITSPLSFWGSVQCALSSRAALFSSGGDPHVAAGGGAQSGSAYRRLTLLDGDNYYGERCELGENDYRTGPTAFYHEGQHRVTYFSERLPSNFPISTKQWQTVMQMKQAQPSHDNGGGVALELQVMNNQWAIANNWNIVQTFPARVNTWTRFAWDVYYSKDPSKGWLQVSADLNGDGDFNDSGERGPIIHTATLKAEASGSFNAADGLAAGTSIPSHLRMGLYHSTSIPCPSPSGCSIDIDNVQVVGPAS